MKRIITVCCLILSSVTGLYAQGIKGLVLDEKGTPIEFANVVLMKDSAFVQGVITDKTGAFTMERPSVAGGRLVITMVGYDSRTVEVPSKADVDLGTIVLPESSVMLGEVTVKADIPVTRMKNGTLVTTVEHTMLAKMGTADDVLAHLPLVSGSEGQFTVFGRGTPIIYINGRLVRNNNELQQLASGDIRSVEVITNPGAQYSSEVQAVIRIKTIPKQGEGFSADLYEALRVSHFVRNMSDLSFNYRHNALEVFADGYFYFGKQQNIDEAEMITSGTDRLYQSIEARATGKFNDMYGKVGFSYQLSENHSVGAYYEFGREYVRTHATPVSQIDMYNGADELTSSETILSDWLSRSKSLPVQEANFYYNGTVGRLDIDFNADFTQKRAESSDDQTETNTMQVDDNRHIMSDGLKKSRLLAEKLVLSHPVWNGSIEVGEEYTNSRLDYGYNYDGAPIGNSLTDIHEDNIAAFATLSQAFGPLHVAVGVRYEHVDYKYFEDGTLQADQSKTYDNLFPTFSLNAKVDQVNLSLSFTGKTLRPSYQQLDGGIRYVNRFAYQCGNPELQPVKRYTVQLSGTWNWWFAQASVNHEVNSIFWTTSPYEGDASTKLLSFENVPHYTQVQVAVGAQPTIGCWKPQAVIGMQKQFYTATCLGEECSFGTPLFSFTLNNSISLPKSWSLGADFQFMTAGDAQNASVRPTNKIDLMVSKSFCNDDLTISLRASDLLNRSAGWTTMYSGDIVTKTYNRAEQRHVRLTLRYTFNSAKSKYRGTGAGENEKNRM